MHDYKIYSEYYQGKRVLITSAHKHFGPWFVEAFKTYGADVIADSTPDYVSDPSIIGRIVEDAGRVDILIPQFAGPDHKSPADKLIIPITEVKDSDFQEFLDHLTWPLIRFTRAVLPQMIERKEGKIVGITSGSALKTIPGMNVYTTAQGAKNAFIKSVGVEVAKYNVQINGIAPNYHRSTFFFTDEMLNDPEWLESLTSQIPAGRMGTEEECASLCLALAGPASDFVNGEIIGFAGGWNN